MTSAEGSKTSAILRAEGAAQARLLAADAEREAITHIAKAMARPNPSENDSESGVTASAQTAGDLSNPAQYLITARYIEGLKDMAKSDNARVVFMPVTDLSRECRCHQRDVVWHRRKV